MSNTQSKKTVRALKSPFSEPSWPTISARLENAILDILLPLLTPIGQHREEHVPISKGKRRKRRKRDSSKKGEHNSQPAQEHVTISPDPKSPKVQQDEDCQPNLLEYMTVGFNSTVRHMELLSQQSLSPSQKSDNDSLADFTLVFACTSTLPPVMAAPLPLLAAMASSSPEKAEPIRLIPILPASASRIAAALKQARANVLGILVGAPGTEELVKMIRNEIKPVEVVWAKQSTDHKYQPLQIHTEEIAVTKPGPKAGKRKRAGSH